MSGSPPNHGHWLRIIVQVGNSGPWASVNKSLGRADASTPIPDSEFTIKSLDCFTIASILTRSDSDRLPSSSLNRMVHWSDPMSDATVVRD